MAGPPPPSTTCRPDDLAVLHFSSGSTGKIKAAMQSYGNRLASMRKMILGMDRPARPGDRLALIGPITHASGMLMQPYLFLAPRWSCSRGSSPRTSWPRCRV
jgi:long-subunit acyl-CoA synthetase (AMP-forming)